MCFAQVAGGGAISGEEDVVRDVEVAMVHPRVGDLVGIVADMVETEAAAGATEEIVVAGTLVVAGEEMVVVAEAEVVAEEILVRSLLSCIPQTRYRICELVIVSRHNLVC